jgi:hypothetical protein
MQRWLNTEPYIVTVEDDLNAQDRVRWVLREKKPGMMPVSDFGVMIGDIVHNLRSALDQLAYRLVVGVSQAPITRAISFPIFRDSGLKTPQQVNSLVRDTVRGSRPHLIDKLSRLEPYEGGRHQILWALHYLDIIDKHRLLVTAAGATRQLRMNAGAMHRSFFADATGEEGDIARASPDLWITLNAAETTFPLEDGTELTSGPRANSKPYDQFQFPIYIALAEPEILKGEPVLPTLIQMVSAVREVVDLFRPDCSGQVL